MRISSGIFWHLVQGWGCYMSWFYILIDWINNFINAGYKIRLRNRSFFSSQFKKSYVWLVHNQILFLSWVNRWYVNGSYYFFNRPFLSLSFDAVFHYLFMTLNNLYLTFARFICFICFWINLYKHFFLYKFVKQWKI